MGIHWGKKGILASIKRVDYVYKKCMWGVYAGCLLNIVFFPQEFSKVKSPRPRKHWAAIGCTKDNKQ